MAFALRQRGIDVTMPADAGLTAASDREHLEFCRASQRVLVAQDADFLALHQRGESHCGIIYAQQQTRSIGEVVRTLALIWELCDSAEFENRVEYI